MDEHRPDDTLSDAERATLALAEGEIRAALLAHPSSEWLARVRAQAAVGATPMTRWWTPWILAGAAAVVLVLVAVMMGLRRQPGTTVVPVTVAGHAADQLPAAPSANAPSAAQEARARVVSAAPAPRPAAARPARRAGPPEVEVIVPPGQLEALRAFVERLRASPLDRQALVLTADGVPSVPRLSEITVTPLPVDRRPMAGETPDGGKER